MVKGISRQVIVVHSPDQKLFDQAIFILKDDAMKDGITDEMLLKAASKLINTPPKTKRRNLTPFGMLCAGIGAMTMGVAWLLTILI